MTERSTARHRAPRKPSSAISTITESLGVVGGCAGSVQRTGIIVAMSSGLVASMGLPANAANVAPMEAESLPSGNAAAPGTSVWFALEGNLLTLPADLLAQDGPLTSSVAANLRFAHADFFPVPIGDIGPQTQQHPKQRRHATQSLGSLRPGTVIVDAAPVAVPVSRRVSRSPIERQSTSHSHDAAKPTSRKPSKPSSAVGGSQVISIASRYMGIPYRWGGTTPRGFDCSGFTQYVYRQTGTDLPRTVAQQRAVTRAVPRSQAMPGDLVFFGNGHMGIFAGGNMMIDSPRTGKSIDLRTIYSANVQFGRV